MPPSALLGTGLLKVFKKADLPIPDRTMLPRPYSGFILNLPEITMRYLITPKNLHKILELI
jgi:hypothetical protein